MSKRIKRKQKKVYRKQLSQLAEMMEQVQVEQSNLDETPYLSFEELKKLIQGKYPELAKAHIMPDGKGRLRVYASDTDECVTLLYDHKAKEWFTKLN